MQKYVIAYYDIAFCSIGMDYSNLKPLYSFDFYLHSTKFIIEMNNRVKILSVDKEIKRE